MENFSYNTLTINGITKICDNNIYTINTNEAINYQWHDYQLKYICNILKIPTKSSDTGLDLLPMKMNNLINRYISENGDNIKSNNLKRDIKYGIIPNKTKNKIVDNNLGGTPSDIFKISDNGLYIVNSDDIVYSHSGKLVINKSRKSKKPKRKPVVIDWNMNRNNSRMKRASRNIESSKNPLLQYGRLDWYANSCYADSVIIMLLYPYFKGNLSQFVIDNFLNVVDIDHTTLGKNKIICNLRRPNQRKSVRIINEVYAGFRKINELLSEGKMFNIYKFLKILDKCPNKTQNIKYGDKDAHDSVEFLNHLMEFYNIQTTNANSIVRYKLFNLNPGIRKYEDTLDGIFRDPVLKPNFDIQETKVDTNKVIVNEIFFDDLRKLLKTLPCEESRRNIAKSDMAKYKYDPVTELYVPIAEIFPYEKSKKQFFINLSNFLRHKRELYPKDYYHIFNPRINKKIEINGKIYIENNDTGVKTEIDSMTGAVRDTIIKNVEKYIEEIIIDDADTLFFNVYRKGKIIDARGKLRNEFLDLVKLIPDEKLTLKTNTLFLRSIIVWYSNHYVTFFMNDNVWYLYNDLFSPSRSPDYIITIGSYDDLLEYSIGSIQNIVMTNSVIFWYQ